MSVYNLGRVLPIFKGEYDPTATYENLDVVLYNGSSYVALNTTTNNLPTDENHWAIVALAGTLSPEQIAEVEQQVIEYVQGQGYVIDNNYTHTDNNFTNADKNKLEGIDMTTKQDTLVSGSNIKTVNNESLLGSGNVSINVPTKTSDLTNDSNFATTSDVSSAVSGKQDTLISGTNIKTINNESLLGSGNITIDNHFESGESVNSVSIINDLTTGGVGNVLSAEQGKVLNNKIEDPTPVEYTATETGYMINWNNGQNYPSASSKSTDYIETTEYTTLKYKSYSSNSAAIVAFYDTNYNYLQSISIRGSSVADEGIIDLTNESYASVKYVRLGVYSTWENYLKLYSTGSLDSRVSALETTVEDLQDQIDELGNHDELLAETVNFEGLASSAGYFLNWSNGQPLQSSSQGSMYSDYYKISGYNTLHCTTYISNSGAAIAFYDGNYTYLQGISVRGTGSMDVLLDLTSSSYASAMYVRVSGYNHNPKATLYNTDSLPYKIDALEAKNYLPENLKILVFGDSITDSMNLGIDFTTNTSTTSNWHTNSYTKDGQTIVYKFWTQLLAEKINTNEIRCYAKSGAKYADWATQGSGNDDYQRQKLSYQIEVALNDLDNSTAFPHTQGTYKPDVIIFALGTNDGAPNDTLQSALNKTVWVQDNSNNNIAVDIEATLANLNRENFFEAVRYGFLKMKSLYPDALFLCVLPIQRWYTTSSPNMTSLHDGLVSICNYYSIPVIDGAFEMGITRDLEVSSGIGKLLKDGLHPNEKGQNVYARMVLSNIISRFIDYNNMNN